MTQTEKENIKQAIFKAVESGYTEPELLLDKLIRTIHSIDNIPVLDEISYNTGKAQYP